MHSTSRRALQVTSRHIAYLCLMEQSYNNVHRVVMVKYYFELGFARLQELRAFKK